MVTGSKLQQLADLRLLVQGWRRTLAGAEKDFLALGDMNLNALTWMEPMFEYPEMAQEIFDFLLGESCVQLTDQNTRIRKVNDLMQRSCLDHVYTNVPAKVSNPVVEAIGRSDHLCINCLLYTSPSPRDY